jgi:hypothetical protein
MHTTAQILDALAEKFDASDYRVGKLLGTSSQTVNHWRKGRTTFGAQHAHRAAALLEWEPAYVLACMEHERAARLEATDEIRATWCRIAERFKPAAAILAAVFFLAMLSGQVVSREPCANSHFHSIHYAKYEALRRLIRRMLRLICDGVGGSFCRVATETSV